MKRTLLMLTVVLLLNSCNVWSFQPFGDNLPTPIRPPTRTPSIVTASPAGAATATPLVATATLEVNTPGIAATHTLQALPSDTASPEPTSSSPNQSVDVKVLGCNTSLDITHGMGEVTNAFVTLTNTGNVALTRLKAILFALDEGREHPDKTAQIALLPVAQQVTVKLTVDSTYNADTPIQIEVIGEGGLFQRLGVDSCKDIGVFAPDPASLNTPVPVNP